MAARIGVVLSAICFGLAACGGGAAPAQPPPPAPPVIQFSSTGNGWSATPVREGLGSVSNNGSGYTGEVDVYELDIPAEGRLQVSLTWDHDSDFDLILAGDRAGAVRLAEGIMTGSEPEYLGIDVLAGQMLFLLVAGWVGDPGDYTIEVVLVEPGVPLFDLELVPDPALLHPTNGNLRFVFNAALDPTQFVSQGLVFVSPGHFAEGRWCIRGSELVFHPRIPSEPGDTGGLHPGARYTLQFPPAGRGIRAANGEYLSELISVEVRTGTIIDPDPATPPRVTDVNRSTSTPWNGLPVVVTVLGPVDPETAFVQLFHVAVDGTETPLDTRFTLTQDNPCEGAILARFTVEPIGLLPTASKIRLRIPGSVLRLGGSSGVTGPAPAPPGAGFWVDFFTA